jgi:hypothetical protein
VKSWRYLAVFAIGLVSGFLASGLFLMPGQRRAALPPNAGAGASNEPIASFELRPNLRYDLYCLRAIRHQLASGEPHAPDDVRVYRECLILGVTGGEDSSRSKSSFSASSGSWKGGDEIDFFKRWLVLKQPDGRLNYIPTSWVRSIEESPAKPPS